MEQEKKDSTSLRGTRGSRAIRAGAVARGRPVEKSPEVSKRESSKPEQSEPVRRGQNQPRGISRIPRRGQNRKIPRINNRRMRQSNRNNRRLERVQNVMRYQPRGPRGRFRARGGFFNMRRRPFSRRSIFISGLPKNANTELLEGELRKEGRVIRCTLLRDFEGNSRGIAFAEMQNPREAWNVIQRWKGKKVGENVVFVAFKREPNRRNYYSRPNYRYGNNRQFNYYGRYYSRFQGSFGFRGNRGRVRGRNRGFQRNQN